MAEKYTSEQFWKLYEKLPQELKDALFAEETGNNIYDICKRNEVLENLEKIVEYVGEVLVGVTPPDDFQESLEKELRIEKDLAKKVAREINRFIFYPVKTSLEEIYKIPVAPAVKEKSTVSPEKDIYREPIE